MTRAELLQALRRYDGNPRTAGQFQSQVDRQRETLLNTQGGKRGRDMATRLGVPQAPVEDHSNGAVEQQFEIARRSLAYADRFEQNKNSAELDARFAEASRAAGVRK
jgi:hypothetical protein